MKKHTYIILFLISIIYQSCTKDDSIDNKVNKTANQQTTGSSANDLLSDNTYKSLAIEIVYVNGYEPTANAINNLVNFINARTYKPNGITIEKRAITSLGNEKYTIKEIADIEDANRTKYNTSNQIALWIFFADGESDKNEGNSVVLGVSYRNTSFAVFEETVQNMSNSPFEPNRALLETTIINHEFGHLLGLTNFGTVALTAHEDTEHPRHCNVQSCLMYWESELSSGISNMAYMNFAPQLDAQCIADLQANGGK